MKRILALTISLMMIAAAVISCTSVPNPPATVTESAQSPTPSTPGKSSGTDASTTETAESTPAQTETPSPTASEPPTPTVSPEPTETPTPTPEPLPSSFTLLGSKHVPKPDNQGSIGSCSSEAVTYMQFTVAVSQYMNHYHPEVNWDPSSDDPDTIFSPKYTYNFSGAGTGYAYSVLMDDGCLPMSVCITDKGYTNKDAWGGSIVTSPKSRAWDVAEGLMVRALNFRLTGYEENEFLQTNNCQLTTNEYGRAIIEKTKDALVRGNAVVLSGWSSYWQYSTIKRGGGGKLGKPGMSAIWNGFKAIKDPPPEGDDSGNHCITIIGYDDDITLNVNGVTMKGAFQLRNSWGNWMDNGNCFIMYDAFNRLSEHKLFNVPSFYDGSFGVSISGGCLVNPLMATDKPLYTTFLPAGETVIGEETYPTYRLFDGANYLTYEKGGLSATAEETQAGEFALIPYEKVVTPAEKDPDYEGSFLICAVNSDKGRYLRLKGLTHNAKYELSDDISSPEFVCFTVNRNYDKQKDGSFSYMIATKKPCSGTKYEHTGTIYRFSWTYWDKDISVGLPELMVEAEVEMTDRASLDIALTRTDKNGVQDRFEPGCMATRIKEGALPGLDLKDGETLSFSGQSNVTVPETGYFAFGYDKLMSVGGNDIDDFLWGVDVAGEGAVLKSLKLIDKDQNVLSTILTGETKPMVKGERTSYAFDFGKELDAYYGTGVYKLRNVGTGKLLTLSSKTQFMTFVFESGNKNDAKYSEFRIEYDAERDGFLFWNCLDTFVFDVTGKKVVDGAKLQMNKLSLKNTSQLWLFKQNEQGQLYICSKDDPSLVFGYNGKDFVLRALENCTENDLWTFEAVKPVSMSTRVQKSEDGTYTVHVIAPEKYESGTITLCVIDNGEVIRSEEVPLENGQGDVVLTGLENKTYVFAAALDGAYYGIRTAYIIRN